MTISNTELRERARTFLGTSMDEWARHVLSLLDENAALVKERDERNAADTLGWNDMVLELHHVKADNARLLKRLRQIHARLDYQDKSAIPKDAILAAQGFCEIELAADDAMTEEGKS